MAGEPVRIYTRNWCEDSQAAKEFLWEHGIPFLEINIEENPDAAKFVMSVNEGKMRTPTFETQRRSFHCSPFDEEMLASDLGLS